MSQNLEQIDEVSHSTNSTGDFSHAFHSQGKRYDPTYDKRDMRRLGRKQELKRRSVKCRLQRLVEHSLAYREMATKVYWVIVLTEI